MCIEPLRGVMVPPSDRRAGASPQRLYKHCPPDGGREHPPNGSINMALLSEGVSITPMVL
jgi:hypothetical protein